MSNCIPCFTLDARGLLVRQRRGASERVVLVSERPLAQAVKSFERADPITLPFISPESKFDPGNLIGRLKKRFLKGLLLVKCVMILAKPVLPKCENKRLRMSIKGNRRRHGSEVVIRWCQRFFSRLFATRLHRSILSPLMRKKPLAHRVTLFRTAGPKNHTLSSGTYSPNKGVPPSLGLYIREQMN